LGPSTPIGLELCAEAPKAGRTPVGPVSIPAGHICWDSKVAFGRAPWEYISALDTEAESLAKPLPR